MYTIREAQLMAKQTQLRALKRWEFEFNESKNSYYSEIDGIKICWNMETQTGAYYFDNELYFIENWDVFEDIMARTDIY